AIHQRDHVQDENHPAIAQNRSPTHQVGGDRLVIERLDDQFVFAHEFVDDDAELAFPAVDHQNEDLTMRYFRSAGRLRAQAQQGQHIVAQLQHVVVLHLTDIFFHRACDLGHGIQRQSIESLLHAEHQRPDDGQRQRQPQTESCAPSRGSFDLDRALQAAEYALHYIQAYAAAREFGDLLRGGKSRLQDEFQSIRFAQKGCLFGLEQSLGQGARPDFFRVNASTVVGDLDDYLIPLMISGQPQGSLRPLAGANPLFRGLDAMANGISHKVGQRLGNRIQNTFVEIGLPAADDQLDFFSALAPDVPHHPREPPEQLIDRHHANLHDRVLQVIQNPPLERHGIGELSSQGIFGEALSKFQQRLLQHRFRQNQFTDQIEYAVNSFRIHAQQVIGAGRHGGSCDRFPDRRRVILRQGSSNAGSRRWRNFVRSFRIAAGNRREGVREQRSAHGSDADRSNSGRRDSGTQCDGGNAAFRSNLLCRFFRHQRRFDASYGLV